MSDRGCRAREAAEEALPAGLRPGRARAAASKDGRLPSTAELKVRQRTEQNRDCEPMSQPAEIECFAGIRAGRARGPQKMTCTEACRDRENRRKRQTGPIAGPGAGRA